MSQQVFFQAWPAGQYNWLSQEPTAVGLQLDGAFRRFAASVNAHPANAQHQLAVLRSHSDATTSTSSGFVWSLGHPAQPLLLSCRNIATTGMRWGAAPNLAIACGLASAYDDDRQVNGGYGSFSSTIYGQDLFVDAIDTTTYTPSLYPYPWHLLIYQDTSEGAEYFGFFIKRCEYDHYSFPYDTGLLIFRSPAGHWCSWWYFPRTLRLFNAGLPYLHGHSYLGEEPYGTVLSEAGFSSSSQQLHNRVALAPDATAVTSRFLVHGELLVSSFRPERLPAVLFAGLQASSSSISRPRGYNYGRRVESDGCFYQLGCKITDSIIAHMDLWLWVPDGMVVDQPPPWQPVTAIEQWIAHNSDLNLIHHPELEEDLQPLTVYWDYRTVVPSMAWMALGLHGLHPLLGLGSAGSTTGGGGRPSSGVLWPRRY